MIDCTAFRRALLAEPGNSDPALRQHRDGCPECAQFAARLLRFDDRLTRAMRLSVPAGNGRGDAGRPVVDRGDAVGSRKDTAPAGNGEVGTVRGDNVIPLRAATARRHSPQTGGGRRRFAFAASLLVAAGVAGVLWLALPRASLADDVVAHMAGEPDAWRRTDLAVAPDKLRAVIADARMDLRANAGMVSYANSCDFRGRHVPHLVVQDPSGPVTVMVLVHESVPAAVEFDEQGYRGVILPVPGHGAIAVLSRGGSLDRAGVDAVAARVRAAIVWTAPADSTAPADRTAPAERAA